MHDLGSLAERLHQSESEPFHAEGSSDLHWHPGTGKSMGAGSFCCAPTTRAAVPAAAATTSIRSFVHSFIDSTLVQVVQHLGLGIGEEGETTRHY